MQGKYEMFYFDGSPARIQYYNHGLEDSTIKAYYYGGKFMYEGKFSLGKKEGLWTYYDNDGKIAHSENYSGSDVHPVNAHFHREARTQAELQVL
jgi:antitoxin component YwqK of YwqJK toxin-antitoxin module